MPEMQIRIWYYQIKWLNMSRKTDKKRARHVDIILLSEIITDSMYWQVVWSRSSVKFGVTLEHILNLIEFKIVSINHNP